MPDTALWPRLPYGYAFHTRAHHVDTEIKGEMVPKPKVTVSLLKGDPIELGRKLLDAAKRGEFPDCIAYGTIDVEFYGSGSAVLELMHDLKRRAEL